MPRQVRIEFPGAIYHVMCRGDRREEIFRDDGDREMMQATLAETVGKTGWQVHAWVWMTNHYHLLLETPEANLVRGMTWFQTTFTTRFNARHHLRGHLFGGRYKAVVVDRGEPRYFSTLLDYIHLNPVRAGIIKGSRGEDLRDYKWSSWGGYVHPRRRQAWHHVPLAFQVWDLEDSVAGRRALRLRIERRMTEEAAERCGLAETGGQSLQSTLRRGWYYGPEERGPEERGQENVGNGVSVQILTKYMHCGGASAGLVEICTLTPFPPFPLLSRAERNLLFAGGVIGGTGIGE